jgi:hypothetical protein
LPPSDLECPPFPLTKGKGKWNKGTAKGKGINSGKGGKGYRSSSGKSGKSMTDYPSRSSNGKAGKAMMEFPNRPSNGKAGMKLIYQKKEDTSAGLSSVDEWQYEYNEKKSPYTQGNNHESKLEKSTSSDHDDGNDDNNSMHRVPAWNIYQMRSGKGYYGKHNKGSAAKGHWDDDDLGKGSDSQGKGWGTHDPLCHPKSEKSLKSMAKGKGGVSKGTSTKGTGVSLSSSRSWSAKGSKGEAIQSMKKNKSWGSSASKASSSFKMSKLSSKGHCWSGKAGMKSYYGTASRTGTQSCRNDSLSSSQDKTKDSHSSVKGVGGDQQYTDYHGVASKKTSENDFRHKPTWDEYSSKKRTKKKSKSSKSKLKSIRSSSFDDGERLEHHQYQPSASYVMSSRLKKMLFQCLQSMLTARAPSFRLVFSLLQSHSKAPSANPAAPRIHIQTHTTRLGQLQRLPTPLWNDERVTLTPLWNDERVTLTPLWNDERVPLLLERSFAV